MARRQPRMMTALEAGIHLRAMLDIVLFESIAAEARKIAVKVETDDDHVRLEILSDATHPNDAVNLRNSIKTAVETCGKKIEIQIGTMGANRQHLAWTAAELARPVAQDEASRKRGHGPASTHQPKGMTKGRTSVQLEYRQNAADAGSTAARIVAEAARYTPAQVAINHEGVETVETVGNEDYLKDAAAVMETDLGRIGVIRTPENPQPAEQRGGIVCLGMEEPLYPDSIDALDNTHYHARIVRTAKREHHQTVEGMRFDYNRQMLREVGMTAVLEHLKDKHVPHRVQQQAARAGIRIPDPPIYLGSWAPAIASETANERSAERGRRSLPYRKPETALFGTTDGTPCVIVKRGDGTHPQAEQLIAIALETENRLRSSAGRRPIRLAVENRDLEGYKAYDRHPYTLPETLFIKNIKHQDVSYHADGSTGPWKPGPARAGWTLCLPIVDGTSGSPTITRHLYLASPVRYSGQTTGKRLRTDYGRKTANPVKPESLKLTKTRGRDPEAYTSRIERFLIDSFGSTTADIPGGDGTRPMVDIALELTETPRNRRLAMITAGVRRTLETYAANTPGLDTVIRARREVADGKMEIEITETPSMK